MKKIKLGIIFLVFILVTTLIVNAEGLCEEEFSSEGFTCFNGKESNLISQGFSCKPQTECGEGKKCCETVNTACCKSPTPQVLVEKSKNQDTGCSEKYGKNNYMCIPNTLKQDNSICITGKQCNGDYCCGTGVYYCCQVADGKVVKNPYVKGVEQGLTVDDRNNFTSLKLDSNSVASLIYEYKSLAVPKENGIGYFDLYIRSSDLNVKRQAVYQEALGYKQIASMRRDFLGIPEYVKKLPKVGIYKPAPTKINEAREVEKPERVSIGSDLQANIDSIEGTVSRSNDIILKDPFVGTVGSFRFAKEWYWGDGDTPDTKVSEMEKPDNELERIALLLKGETYPHGLQKIINFANTNAKDITIRQDLGNENLVEKEFRRETETQTTKVFSERQMLDIITTAARVENIDPFVIENSYILEINQGGISTFRSGIQLKYTNERWQYKINEEDKFISDLKFNREVKDLNFYNKLIYDLSEEKTSASDRILIGDYGKGIEIITKALNDAKDNPQTVGQTVRSYFGSFGDRFGTSITIQNPKGEIKLPRSGESRVILQELMTLAATPAGEASTKSPITLKNREFILDGDIDLRLMFTDKWQWCLRSVAREACNNEPSTINNFDTELGYNADKYKLIIKNLQDQTYEGGLGIILEKTIEAKILEKVEVRQISLEIDKGPKINFIISERAQNTVDVLIGNKRINDFAYAIYQPALPNNIFKNIQGAANYNAVINEIKSMTTETTRSSTTSGTAGTSTATYTLPSGGSTSININKNYLGKMSSTSNGGVNNPQMIVLHDTGASFAQTIKIFQDESKGETSHYIIDKDGTIYQLVEDKIVANHVKTKKLDSIGIKIVNIGFIDEEYTDSQYNSLQFLLDYLTQKYNIVYDSNRILANYKVEPAVGYYKSKGIKEREWDPSPNFNWSRICLSQTKLLDLIGLQACLDEVEFYNTGYNCNNI